MMNSQLYWIGILLIRNVPCAECRGRSSEWGHRTSRDASDRQRPVDDVVFSKRDQGSNLGEERQSQHLQSNGVLVVVVDCIGRREQHLLTVSENI